MKLGCVTIFAPLFITLLIRFVSGVPLLEKKYAEDPEFQAYCRETNVFVPWWPQKDLLGYSKHSDEEQLQTSEK